MCQHSYLNGQSALQFKKIKIRLTTFQNGRSALPVLLPRALVELHLLRQRLTLIAFLYLLTASIRPKLQLRKSRIQWIVDNKLVMFANSNNAALIHHGNAICL